MARSVSLNGSSFSIPGTGDSGWSQSGGVDDYLVALATGVLTKAGGTFTLSAEANLGATYGLKSAYLKTQTLNPAAAGVLRLAKTDTIGWRNNANGADLALTIDASDNLTFNGTKVGLSGNIVNADINAAAAIAYSKLALTGAIQSSDLAGSIAYSKLTLTGSIVNADVSAAAAIAYSKLNLSGAVKLASDVTGLLPAANGGTGVLSTATFPTSGVVVTEAGTETLTNKTLTAPVISSIVNTGTLTLPTATTTLVGTDVTQTLSNKTVLAGTSFKLVDPTDQTKVAEFDVSGIGTGTTNTYILPNVTGNTVVLNAATQTLINKDLGSTTNTLTGARASYLSPDGTHTVSFPGSTDTLVGRTTTDTLTNKTLTAPAFGSYTDWTEQGSAPVTPSAGALRVYSKTDHRLYTKDSSGVETAVGSGSGTGQKNYITNPSAASTTTGWSLKASSTGTLARDTSSSLPRLQTTGSGFKYTSSATDAADYIYTRFTLDDADKARKLGAWLSQNTTSTNFQIQVWKNSASDYSGTYTQFTLPTDVSSVSALPAADTDYKTSFDTDTTVWLELRIKHAAASAEVLYFSDTIVGPGVTVQGAAVTQWQSYTPTVVGNTTSASVAQYRRVGDTMQVQGYLTASNTTTTTLSVSLPSGLTINASALAKSGALDDVLGYVTVDGSTYVAGNVLYQSSTTVVFAKTGATSVINGTNTIVSGNIVDYSFTVPVNEWAGSGTVNVASNDLQYYYGTGGSWGTSATVTTAQGPGGVLGGTTAPAGASFAYTIVPTYPVPVGTVPYVETSPDQVHWTRGTNLDAPGPIEALKNDGTNYVGVGASVTTAGNIKVTFGKYASGITTAPNNWGGTWYWRVTVGLPGQAVGFGIVQPGVSSGLVSASGVPGNTGNAIAAGYVGEKISGTVTTRASAAVISSASTGNLSSLTLTPGVWCVTGFAGANSISSMTSVDVQFSTTNATIIGAAGDGTRIHWERASADTNLAELPLVMPTLYVTVSSNTQYWLVTSPTGGSTHWYGYMNAVRIA